MIDSNSLSVGIAGVTGKFAGLVLDSLLKDPTLKIRGYCRDAAKLADKFAKSPQVEIVEGEADNQAALDTFVAGLDVVICTYLGDNDFMIMAQKALVDACDQARVARYIASDYCFDYSSLEIGAHPAKDPMKIIHGYVQAKQNVKGVHILIGVFMETFWSDYFQVLDAREHALNYWGTGEETWESTTYSDAASYTAAVALDHSAVGFQKFLGDKKSIREIAAAFEKVYGFPPKLHCQGSLDDLYAKMQSLHAEHPSSPYTWLALFYQYYCTDGQTYIAGRLDNDKYPQVKPQTFQDFLQAHALAELPVAMQNLSKRN